MRRVLDKYIRTIMKEIINFLDLAEADFKSYIATNALVAAEKHSPSKRWHIDTVLTLLIKVVALSLSLSHSLTHSLINIR